MDKNQDLLNSLPGSEDSDSDSKGQSGNVCGQTKLTNMQAKSIGGNSIKVVGNVGNGHEAQNVYDPRGIAPTVRENHGKTTKIIEDSQLNSTREILGQLTLLQSPTTNSCVRDSLVRHFLSLAKEKGSRIPVEPCFLRYAESSRLKDHTQYSLKTSKDCSTITEGKPFESSYNRWMNWGMMWSGRCLTANFSVCRRIEKGCSLSDILETEIDQKYYLSEKTVKMFLKLTEKNKEKGNGFAFRPLQLKQE